MYTVVIGGDKNDASFTKHCKSNSYSKDYNRDLQMGKKP